MGFSIPSDIKFPSLKVRDSLNWQQLSLYKFNMSSFNFQGIIFYKNRQTTNKFIWFDEFDHTKLNF